MCSSSCSEIGEEENDFININKNDKHNPLSFNQNSIDEEFHENFFYEGIFNNLTSSSSQQSSKPASILNNNNNNFNHFFLLFVCWRTGLSK